MAITGQDLAQLYEMAKAAPMQRAGDAPVVVQLFARVEEALKELGEAAVKTAADEIAARKKAADDAAKQPPADPPPKPVTDAVHKAVAEAS